MSTTRLPLDVHIVSLADYERERDPDAHSFDLNSIRAALYEAGPDSRNIQEYRENQVDDINKSPYTPKRFDFGRLLRDLKNKRGGFSGTKRGASLSSGTKQFRGCTIVPPTVVIVEGLYALYNAEVRAEAAVKIFVDLDGDVRLGRWILRDAPNETGVFIAICNEYINWCRPEMERYIYSTKDAADVILPQGNETESVKLVANGIYDRVYKEFVEFLAEERGGKMAGIESDEFLSPVVTSIVRNEAVPMLSLAEEAGADQQFYDVN